MPAGGRCTSQVPYNDYDSVNIRAGDTRLGGCKTSSVHSGDPVIPCMLMEGGLLRNLGQGA